MFLKAFQVSDANDHAGYDCAEFTNDNSRDKEATTLQTIQNSYNGGEVETNETESIKWGISSSGTLRKQNKGTIWYNTHDDFIRLQMVYNFKTESLNIITLS